MKHDKILIYYLCLFCFFGGYGLGKLVERSKWEAKEEIKTKEVKP